jgi:hypothetical protein
VDELLDPAGLSLMRSITKSRFRRFENEQRGAQAIIDLLQKHLNLKIEYDPRAGVLLVTPPGELPIISLFGSTQERLTRLAQHRGCSSEAAFETAIDTVHELCNSGSTELEIIRRYAFALKAIKDQGGDIDDFRDASQAKSPKPRTKPGAPDIEELKRLLVSRPKRRRS